MKITLPFSLLVATALIWVLPQDGMRAEETPRPSIPFNSQNKETATKIYQLINNIQNSEFDPETNLTAITKLQECIAQTDFSAIKEIGDYIRDSVSLNSLRSKDIKVESGNADKRETLDLKKTAGHVSANMRSPSVGADYEKSTTKKNNDDNTSGFSISSQNEVAVLDKTRQQQSTSYGHLLIELKRLGFARPIDPHEIYGRWKWECKEESGTYEFDFRPDGTVNVKLKPESFVKWVGNGFSNRGRGEWNLDYRALSVKMNDVNLAFFWKQQPLLFFTDREIVTIDSDRMLLAISEDNELKRIKEKP